MSTDAKSELSFELIKETYIGVFKKYLVIEGRARRREFWIFFLCNLILSLIPGLNFIVALATIVPNFTVGVRRLHDTNRSGKWLLIWLIPASLMLIAMFTGFTMYSSTRAYYSMRYGIPSSSLFSMNFAWLIGLASIVSLGLGILFLVWAAEEGTHGSNNYGPDPKASDAAGTETKTTEEKPFVFCGECGAKNERGTKFCGECGKPI